MSGFQFVSNLVHSVAWPTAVVLTALLLRRSVSHLIRRVTKVTFPGGSVEAIRAEEEAGREAIEENVQAIAAELNPDEDFRANINRLLQSAVDQGARAVRNGSKAPKAEVNWSNPREPKVTFRYSPRETSAQWILVSETPDWKRLDSGTDFIRAFGIERPSGPDESGDDEGE